MTAGFVDAAVDGGVDAEIERIGAAVGGLVAHDGRHGADGIAPVAVRLWRRAQRRLDGGHVPGARRNDYRAAVAETAELAGWLLFDADDQRASRNATVHARMLARQAGDRSMERFALTNLAMQDVEIGRPGEALHIADALLSQPRIPPRIALLARIRRARALADLGCGPRAADDLRVARAALEDSLSSRDPAWTWWVDECEVGAHEGAVLLALGDAAEAAARLEDAAYLAASRSDARGSLYFQVSLVQSYADARAWRECEDTLTAVPATLETVVSGRNRRRLRAAMRGVLRDERSPRWLRHTVHDVAKATGNGPT
ncbi:hypothetical protein [Streptomonospora alba]|uniref:hypothetical protein n=1 Tax=Streptomonospora alba TaxID=183763 RepID=UPI000699B296|nr:hypothetical protein [Streptomonospora alba]